MKRTKRVKKAIFGPVTTDLSAGGIGISFLENARMFFSATLNKNKGQDLSDIELSKAINPFALTRAVIYTTGLTIGLAINKAGSNTLPAQAAKVILVTPFTTTAAILKPFSKIDEAVVSVANSIGKHFNNSNVSNVPTAKTNPVQKNNTDRSNTNSSEDSDQFIRTVRKTDADRKAEENEYDKLSHLGNPHVARHQHHLSDSASQKSGKNDEKINEERNDAQFKQHNRR